MVWYPLGRPVGSTIYPGMQFTAVFIKNHILPNWSLNDVCCYMPTWFGVLSSAMTGLIAYECSIPQNCNTNILRVVIDMVQGKITNNAPSKGTTLPLGLNTPAVECGIAAMACMAIVPAHLMRSVGGGYDNESVAISAMVGTFYFWVRSLRNYETYSFLWSIIAGLSYFYMVAAWGGYIFVLNMIGVHAATMVLLGRFSNKIYASYSLFYFIGTALAIQVPVVGWAPLKSLEQLGPCAVFLGYQVLQFCEIVKRRNNLSRKEAWTLRIQVAIVGLIVAIVLMYMLVPSGYFGPISSRVRGLFVQHTKTGNPLVDSVAEHQPASSRAYFQYLHHICIFAPIGFLITMFNLSDSSSFLLVWGTAAYFFSHKMVRLILLTAPIGTSLAGIAVGRIVSWCLKQLWGMADNDDDDQESMETPAEATNGAKKDTKKKKAKKAATGASSNSSSFDGFKSLKAGIDTASKSKEGIIVKRIIAVVLLFVMYMVGNAFKQYCFALSKDLSNPTIIVKAKTRDGRTVYVDDYREAYWWLRDNTPEDARIMAWWDYGYQITGIANRTTIADGNTWNHEHIALLGMALTTNMDEGYEIARHLADYVLVWGGGGGDDLAKSPHLARIANSVYRDLCPEDPTCRSFGFIVSTVNLNVLSIRTTLGGWTCSFSFVAFIHLQDRQGTPSERMRRSLLYRLHSHKLKPGVEADPDKFDEVFRSKYGRVRIFKVLGVSEESKKWVADPANLVCDVPGSWFCPGQYPPGLATILAKKRDFSQLEDFNAGAEDEEYQKAYFEALNNPELAKKKALEREAAARMERGEDASGSASLDQAEKDKVYNTWADTEDATRMWSLINNNEVAEIEMWLSSNPKAAYIRSKDGRGPMWWAFEKRNQEVVKILMKAGVPSTDRDAQGLSPLDLLQGGQA